MSAVPASDVLQQQVRGRLPIGTPHEQHGLCTSKPYKMRRRGLVAGSRTRDTGAWQAQISRKIYHRGG